MAFESCKEPEPWKANLLLSPETALATDTLLTFQLGPKRRGSLDVYATSDVEHISVRIAEFAPSSTDVFNETVYNMTGNDDVGADQFTEETVCVPSASDKIAFVALQPDVMITNVVLTDTPCTATAHGNKPSFGRLKLLLPRGLCRRAVSICPGVCHVRVLCRNK